MEYKILEHEEHVDLAKAVNDAINEGFEPQGGLATIAYQQKDRNGDITVYTYYSQAMVRR